jgi:hypothetical protein
LAEVFTISYSFLPFIKKNKKEQIVPSFSSFSFPLDPDEQNAKSGNQYTTLLFRHRYYFIFILSDENQNLQGP